VASPWSQLVRIKYVIGVQECTRRMSLHSSCRACKVRLLVTLRASLIFAGNFGCWSQLFNLVKAKASYLLKYIELR
jgi:hypothetical protein